MTYSLISVAAGAVCVFQNFKTVEIGPGFSVACHHRCEVRGNIYIYLLSVMHRWKKNSFVIPAFLNSFHSFCHCSFVSSSILLIGVFIGSLLKTISAALSHAAAFASRSASSFPTIPTWTLTHDISMFQSALSRLVIFFLISSTRWLWFLVLLIESILILLPVKMVAVRRVFCGMLILVCMYVCMHVCMYICNMYVFMYVCMHACMYVCMCIYVCTYALLLLLLLLLSMLHHPEVILHTIM